MWSSLSTQISRLFFEEPKCYIYSVFRIIISFIFVYFEYNFIEMFQCHGKSNVEIPPRTSLLWNNGRQLIFCIYHRHRGDMMVMGWSAGPSPSLLLSSLSSGFTVIWWWWVEQRELHDLAFRLSLPPMNATSTGRSSLFAFLHVYASLAVGS